MFSIIIFASYRICKIKRTETICGDGDDRGSEYSGEYSEEWEPLSSSFSENEGEDIIAPDDNGISKLAQEPLLDSFMDRLAIFTEQLYDFAIEKHRDNPQMLSFIGNSFKYINKELQDIDLKEE